jgi:hypothetical protein
LQLLRFTFEQFYIVGSARGYCSPKAFVQAAFQVFFLAHLYFFIPDNNGRSAGNGF